MICPTIETDRKTEWHDLTPNEVLRIQPDWNPSSTREVYPSGSVWHVIERTWGNRYRVIQYR